MDDPQLIAEVLCRLDLPDREVYPALAHLRDHPTPEAREALLKAFEACVRLGLDLPAGTNHWQKLANHSALSNLSQALQERAGSLTLYDQLQKAANRLHLADRDLTLLFQQLRFSPAERVEQLLLPALFKAARQKLAIKMRFSAWLILRDRPELQDLPELRNLLELQAGIEVLRAAGSPLGYVRSLAYQIHDLLSDHASPPDFGEQDDGGQGVPRRPRSPKGSQPGKKRPER